MVCYFCVSSVYVKKFISLFPNVCVLVNSQITGVFCFDECSCQHFIHATLGGGFWLPGGQDGAGSQEPAPSPELPAQVERRYNEFP